MKGKCGIDSMKVKIYQTDDRRVMFRHFDSINQSKDNFIMEKLGYKMVMEFDYNSETQDRNQLLEELFMYLNRDDRPMRTEVRSMSVSDIIVLDNDAYYCDSFGFQSITLGSQKERKGYYRNR